MANSFMSVLWEFNPTLLKIFGLEIRWYGLMWVLAIGIGTLFFIQFVRREGLPAKVSDSIFIYGVIATVLGARLGHCLFYDRAYYLDAPLQILNFRDGGLASHGAAIGLLIGLGLFSWRNKLHYTWSLDRIMIPVAVGGALVRLGNLFNHEIYGGPTDLPWGFRFVENLHGWMLGAQPIHGPASHPTQIYEALCYLILFGILCWLYYKRDTARRHPGLMFGVGLIGIFLSRFFIEFIKNPQVDFEKDMSLNMGQILSIPFIIVGVIMIIYGLRHTKTPRPLADTSFWPKAVAETPKSKTTSGKSFTKGASGKSMPKGTSSKPEAKAASGKRKSKP